MDSVRLHMVGFVVLGTIMVSVTSAVDVTVEIESHEGVAVPSGLLGFTNSFTVPDDPKYGPRFGNAGILTIDLADPKLRALVKSLAQFEESTWRIGGTPADVVVYDIGSPPECPRAHQGPYPEPMCLSMERWAEICEFAHHVNARLVFGLNGMYHRDGAFDAMNTTNIKSFLAHVASPAGYCPALYAFELGNELGNSYDPTEWKVEPETMARSFREVRALLDDAFNGSAMPRPKLAGPDNLPDWDWDVPFLLAAANAVEIITYHEYDCNGWDDMDKCKHSLMQPDWLDDMSKFARHALSIREEGHAHSLPVWAGEIGPASAAGFPGLTDRFRDNFYYLDKLGALALSGVRVFARSTLAGGDYELLNHTTFQPNPDYWAAWMWHNVMGNMALGVTRKTSTPSNDNSHLRVYAMCARSVSGRHPGDIAVLLMNMHPNQTFSVSLSAPRAKSASSMAMYHIRASPYDNILSDTCEILTKANMRDSDELWTPLKLGPAPTFAMPTIEPLPLDLERPVKLPAYTWGMVVMSGVDAVACL